MPSKPRLVIFKKCSILASGNIRINRFVIYPCTMQRKNSAMKIKTVYNAPNYLVGCVISKRGRKTSRIAFSLWILEYYVYATHYIIGHSRIICRWKLRKNSEKYPWRNGIGTMANCCIVNCNWSSSLPPHYSAFHSLHILILTFLDFVLQWATKMFKKKVKMCQNV